MYKEYYVAGGYYLHGKFHSKIHEASWGVDEYDALERFIRNMKQEMSIPQSTVLPAFCRLLPTGRQINHLRAPRPAFIESEDDEFVKEIISRFYIRFAFSESEDELIGCGKEFKAYADRYPISEHAIRQMRQHYLQQLIRLNNAVPANFSLNENMPSSLPADEYVQYYCKKALSYLRTYGYRIKNQGEFYLLTSPGCHDMLQGKSQSWNAIPLDVVIHWERFAQNLGLDITPTVAFLGYSVNEEHCVILNNDGVIPLITTDDVQSKHLYVLSEQKETAINVLRSHNVTLREDGGPAHWCDSYRTSP